MAFDPFNTKVPEMHSHDRTLIASLGFADRDKQDSRHDLACQFLSLLENAQILACHCLEVSGTPYQFKGDVKTQPEKPITKGSGQYQTVVGFVDVQVIFSYVEQHFADSGSVFVEVKTNPIAISEAIRQINLYRTYIGNAACRFWVLATTFNVSDHEARLLLSQRIYHVKLGEKFDAWVASSKIVAPSQSFSL